jgi:hypothetical protein
MTQKNDKLYLELIQSQRKDCRDSKKLNLSELRRISKNLDNSIFDQNNCSIWNGYITNNNSDIKPSYINFYFRNKKIALHRLLYENYIDDIDKNQYLKYSCTNKGICCNINHIEVVNSNKNTKPIITTNDTKDNNNNNDNNNDKTNLIVNFD